MSVQLKSRMHRAVAMDTDGSSSLTHGPGGLYVQSIW
jgi:hypothetical protein